MFNFFKKEIHFEYEKNLAKMAKIETVYEEGKISGLFIILHGDINLIKSKIKNPEAKSAFIKVIEERIKNNDYEDTRPLFLDDFITYKTKDKDTLIAIRAVMTPSYEPIFNWNMK
jgi:PHP family Zn ribbon phosphoesterase